MKERERERQREREREREKEKEGERAILLFLTEEGKMARILIMT